MKNKLEKIANVTRSPITAFGAAAICVTLIGIYGSPREIYAVDVDKNGTLDRVEVYDEYNAVRLNFYSPMASESLRRLSPREDNVFQTEISRRKKSR
jgi:hypothetical protein